MGLPRKPAEPFSIGSHRASATMANLQYAPETLQIDDILSGVHKPARKSRLNLALPGTEGTSSGFQPSLLTKPFQDLIDRAKEKHAAGQLEPTRSGMIGELGPRLGGIDRIDISYLCGLHGYSYMGITSRAQSDQPLTPISRALLVKLHHVKPEVCLIERPNRPADLHALIKQVPGFETITQYMFTAMLGLERGSYHRFLTGGETSPVIDRFVTTICRYLQRQDITDLDREELILLLMQNAVEEAVARGFDMELFVQRGFASKKAVKPKRSRSAVAASPTPDRKQSKQIKRDRRDTDLRSHCQAAFDEISEAILQLPSAAPTKPAYFALKTSLAMAVKADTRFARGRFSENQALIQAAEHLPACKLLLEAAVEADR